MGDTAVRVENLGKKYIINHQQERYTALRDVIANKVKSIGKKKLETGAQEEFWALKDVSFDIKQGDRVGIIGRNGAGKSTILKLLSRITQPTTGSIALKGRVSSLLEVGTGFHPELTGRENIYLNGAILGMSRQEIKRRFDEIVEFAEIERFLDTPVKRYSSGMYVRLAFSVAAHLEPEILIIDEVLAVGDAQFQKKCLGKMEDVGNSGRTILFVTHNMSMIMELCKNCMLLDKGKLINLGSSKEIVDQYLLEGFKYGDAEIDLTSPTIRRNSLENSIFKWTKVEIINSIGEKTSSISLGEPFEISVYGKLNESVEYLEVGFGVMTEIGISLFNSHIDDTDLPTKYNAGNLNFRVKFPINMFAPGSYTIDFGANGKGIIDWIPEALKFNVESGSNNGIKLRSNFSGLVLHPCVWSIDYNTAN